jgi:nicotinamidase-related amidase
MKKLSSPIPPTAIHLCVDMQNIFAPGGPWATPWMERVLPVVREIAGRHAQRTIFTRFITPENPEQLPGMWKHYYEKWRETTRAVIDPQLLDLLPELKTLVPPASVIDKTRYSAFAGTTLHQMLRRSEADTLIITGSETDVCVLSTVLSAVDLGYRAIVVTDAICSSSDAGHDALMTVYHQRYSLQVETATAEDVLSSWNRG